LEVVMVEHPTPTTIRDMEVAIRIFLSSFDKFDRAFNKYPPGHSKYTPCWITKYNFLSLLKLPDQVKEFGPVRAIWEGGATGEGFLRYIKPEITRGLRYTWQQWILNNFLERKAFDMISRQYDECSTQESNGVHDQFKIYPSAAAAIRKFTCGDICSLIAYGKDIGMVYRSMHKLYILQIRCHGFVSCVMAMNYFMFELRETNGYKHCILLDDLKKPVLGALLLPRMTINGYMYRHEGHPESTIVTSSWRSMIGVEA
jgi:hypothetical protein